MDNEILTYWEMCGRESAGLQRGMNFGIGGDHSVVLTSVRKNAPYDDRFEDDGATLIYRGTTRGGPVVSPTPRRSISPPSFRPEA